MSLYLLDTKVEGNPDWARDVTDTLYGGDRENRLRQELVLGVGGVRVLRELGLAADRLPPERGPLGVPPARAAARARRGGGRRHATRRSSGCARRRSSRRTRPCRPATRSSTRELVRAEPRPLVERCGFTWEEFAELGKVQPDDDAVRSDAVRAADVGVRERRLRAARRRCRARCGTSSGRTGRSTRCRSPRSRTACTRARGSPTSSRSCSGTLAPDFARALELDDDVLWAAHRAAKKRMLEFIARTRGAGEPRSRRADDRLRAPLRDVQARRPPLQPARAARAAARRSATGRSRSSSPARRTRRTRAART